eukprot:9864082-Karenia_brevis.AAC.1
MSKEGSALFLALDWARAFDCIKHASLLDALRRFGLPQHLIDIVSSMYIDRKFIVREAGHSSTICRQEAG